MTQATGHKRSESLPRTARARARDELTREIKEEARRQVASHGAAGLSLRSVARELGMVPSGLYRYYASRDDLLTALIVDAYDAIGAAGEAGDAARARGDLFGRWRAIFDAVRRWATAHPHEYALVYGTPVPGYRAPEVTVAHASRITLALASVLQDGAASGLLSPPDLEATLSPTVRDEAARLLREIAPAIEPEAVFRGISAWTLLFGTVSFELFGHLDGVVVDRAAFFEATTVLSARLVGLPLEEQDA